LQGLSLHENYRKVDATVYQIRKGAISTHLLANLNHIFNQIIISKVSVSSGAIAFDDSSDNRSRKISGKKSFDLASGSEDSRKDDWFDDVSGFSGVQA